MKMKAKHIVLGIVGVFLFFWIIGMLTSNNDSGLNNENNNQAVIPTVTEDGKTTFEVTPELAQSRDLPPVSFAVSYQESPRLDVTTAIAGQQNLNYVTFERYDGEDNFLESFGIGYFDDTDAPSDQLRLDLLEELVLQLVSTTDEFDIVSMEKETFYDQNAYVANFTREKNRGDGIINNYLTQVVLLPNSNGGNGVTLTFNAIQPHPTIAAFSDFGSIGALAEVFESFTFL